MPQSGDMLAAAAASSAAGRTPGHRRGRQPADIAAAASVERRYETITHWEELRALARHAARSAAVRLRHRDDQPRLHEGGDRGRLLLHRAGASPPTCRSAMTIPARPTQLIARASARRAQAVAGGSRRAARSGTTSSTTRTCSRTTASRWPACASTRCWSPTCGTASRRATTWTRTRSATSASRTINLRGRRRQGRQADLLRPGAGGDAPPIRRRGCGRHAAAAPGAVAAAAERAAAGSACTRRSSSRWCRCCNDGAPRRAGRSRAAARPEPRVRDASCRSCCCRRIARPGHEFNIDRRSSCSRSCSRSCSCR